jgi:hypothetical protein
MTIQQRFFGGGQPCWREPLRWLFLCAHSVATRFSRVCRFGVWARQIARAHARTLQAILAVREVRVGDAVPLASHWNSTTTDRTLALGTRVKKNCDNHIAISLLQ